MPEDEVEQPAAPQPFWSGTISFGLVSIPVNLYPANRPSHVGLRLLAADGTPLRRRYYSSKTGRELAPEQMVRAYEIEKDRYVVVTDDELEKLEPEKSRDIDLKRIVNIDAIPPLYFERGYFLAPAEESTKAYRLLAAVMEKTGRAGVATFVMRGKEYLIAIVAEKGILRAETMRFKDEIRSPEAVGLPEKSKAPAAQVRRYEQLIAKRSAEELPGDEVHDATATALLEIVKKKQANKANVIESGEAAGDEPPGSGMLEALKRSLAGHPGARTRRPGKTPRASRGARPARAAAARRRKRAG